MASTQKKNTSSSNSKVQHSSSSKNSKTTSKTKSVSKSTKYDKIKIARGIGIVVCLFLAFFGAIGYFKVSEGAFIFIFCHLIKGLCGFGFYITPPMLLICAWLLAFHPGQPVKLRVTTTLLLPVFIGCISHLFICEISFDFSSAIFRQLWNAGITYAAGGVFGGLLAISFQRAFSKVGALVIFFVLVVVSLMVTFHIAPMEIVNRVRSSQAKNDTRKIREDTFESSDFEKDVPVQRQQHNTTQPKSVSITSSKRPNIDIPVDDNPVLAKQPTTPVTSVRKKNLFTPTSNVLSPDKVISGDTTLIQENFEPEYEDAPEIKPIMDDLTEKEEINSPIASAMQDDLSCPSPEVIEPPTALSETSVKKISENESEEIQTENVSTVMPNPEQKTNEYRYPQLTLLSEGSGSVGGEALNELHANQQRLEDTLHSFGVDAHIVKVTCGPSVTRYELALEQGVKLNKITNLSDDIALSLGATAVRIAPIPDKISTVGIEVPNRSVSPVAIREVLSSDEFTKSKSKVSFAVGKDIAGNCVVGNIAKLPHMLIAGTTGSGKSVCTNSLIISLLFKATPEEVRLIMVDPKMVELGVYNGIPHLLIPVVTDPKKAAGALQWAVNEMMKRYREFSEVGAKDLESYNNHIKKDGKDPMPQIVVVIDELADLMLVAAKEVEESICRVAQMGRAAGMHLIIATQRPSADVITGLMKANIPSRIAFAVASSLESRIILDTSGAEKLVGKGDMLYFPLGSGKPQRIQGCFISEEEVAAVINFIKESSEIHYDEAVLHEIEQNADKKDKESKNVTSSDNSENNEYDELFPAAVDVFMDVGQASVSMLQRRLKLGYGRAARLVDQMEEKGIVGPFEGSKPRQLLVTKEQWQEMKFRQGLVDTVSDSFNESSKVENDFIPTDSGI